MGRTTILRWSLLAKVPLVPDGHQSVGEERISIWERDSILFSSKVRGYSRIADGGAEIGEHIVIT